MITEFKGFNFKIKELYNHFVMLIFYLLLFASNTNSELLAFILHSNSKETLKIFVNEYTIFLFLCLNALVFTLPMYKFCLKIFFCMNGHGAVKRAFYRLCDRPRVESLCLVDLSNPFLSLNKIQNLLE